MKPLRIGTRGSPLALWQANHVAERLRAVAPNLAVELVIIQTEGDRVQDRPLGQIGGDGLFTKAIQQALLDDRADVAVHSLKDLPTAPVAELHLAAVPTRGPTGDAFISLRHRRFDDLPRGARLATGSIRRKAQIRHRRPDLELVEIRGNVDSRLRRLSEGNLDGLILAQAGLTRLGHSEAIAEILDSNWMLPAVGQGALGLECRKDDSTTNHVLEMLDDRQSHSEVEAERSFLMALGGGCLAPIAALATTANGQLTLRGAVLSPDGTHRLAGHLEGSSEQAAGVGSRLAEQLLQDGAEPLIRG